jgi:hypothetical protein
MTQAVISGTPVVAVPFNPDQVIHSLRFQELGLGRVVNTINYSFFSRAILGNWKGFERLGMSVRPDRIAGIVDEVYDKRTQYRKRIRSVVKNWDTNGAVRATDSIAQL